MSSKPISALAKAHEFLDFVNASPTPYHVVRSIVDRLATAGFTEIRERESWSHLQPGRKYYLTRNGSSVVAFAIGRKWKPGNSIAMIGAHTDSPCLRIKPISKKFGAGFLQVGVETYGGGMWHTWFDRDLSIAGRAICKDGKGNFIPKLIKVEKPILRIPTLAVHLDRKTNFEPNKETELFPIAGLIAADLNKLSVSEEDKKTKVIDEEKEFEPLKSLSDRHHPRIVEIIAEHAEVSVDDLVDFEVILYDTQKSCIGGLNDELIFSSRLDNLGMAYCAIEGLIESVASPTALVDESSIRLSICFDHEEIGSTSAQGAASNLLPAVLRRLSVITPHPDLDSKTQGDYHSSFAPTDLNTSTTYEQSLSTSFLISADMAHSVHPNYTQKYETDHHPEINKGTVIKINANQRYATDCPGIVLLQEISRRAQPAAISTTSEGVPLQLFVVRNDSPCGSTIGPMLSASLGSRTLDLGNPQLSMHSIRETGGVYDIEVAIKLFESFFVHYTDVESRILID
ncbi:Aspartyl aminopeptidase [Golovinomyces cichoracearum]|uniref:aspartyl aminopeptidase n=1 Tax=Golovinomyces cichoracearum TaxID=62708 RepID=A0A420HWD8_9PEZI|nr:Aspartyl aminopeptidase [Golovinomyces cichoracearum]